MSVITRIATQFVVIGSLFVGAMFAYHPALSMAEKLCQPLMQTEPVAKWYAYQLNRLVRRNVHRTEFPVMSQATIPAIVRYLLDSEEISPSEAKMFVRASEQLAIYRGKVFTAREYSDIQFVVEEAI